MGIHSELETGKHPRRCVQINRYDHTIQVVRPVSIYSLCESLCLNLRHQARLDSGTQRSLKLGRDDTERRTFARMLCEGQQPTGCFEGDKLTNLCFLRSP